VADPELVGILRRRVAEWNESKTPHSLARRDLTYADLANLDLHGVNFDTDDLRGADLSGTNLEDSSFHSAVCAGANFRAANFRNANLSFADFTVTDLSGAVFDHAILAATDLEGANLSESGLQTAFFYRANLRRVNLARARLLHTAFSDSTLSGATGLDSCLHFEYSPVDFRTLANSGQLPIAFLRGIALPERLIELLPTLLQPAEIQTQPAREAKVTSAIEYRVFISARRLDMLMALFPASHLSLIVRDENGIEHEYQGHPQSPIPGAFGRIIVTSGLYRPRPDRQGVRVPLPWDRPASEAISVLDTELTRLNELAVAYDPLLGPNSNTTVRTFLVALGIEPLQPAAWAPGFDHEAL
jgi:hypothetical protein